MRFAEAVASLMGLLLVACLSSAWWLPRTIHVSGHSKESECRTNLKAIYVGQRSLRDERGMYARTFAGFGFQPEYGNRYLYLLDRSWRVAERQDADVPMAFDSDATAIGPDPRRTTETSVSLRAKLPVSVEGELGVRGDCDAGTCGFTAACIANLDDDETPDVWTISTEPTVDLDGETIPPGVPAHRVSDRAD